MANHLEKAAAKTMGKLKDVQSMARGLKGVFKTLSEQHAEVSALLKRGKSSNDAEKRGQLWREIRTELLSHEQAETAEVYSVLAQLPETRDLAAHHATEAKELEQLITRVDSLDSASDAWKQSFERLADTVKRHADEEEKDIFPKAQRAIGTERAEELDAAFRAEKKRIELVVT